MSKNDVVQKASKKFGKGSLFKLGDKPIEDVEVISTQCDSLDRALGVGGLPKGRIVEIFGPESSGKTTLAMHVMAECQKQNGTVGFVDAEHAFDPAYARNLGMDTDELLLSQPNNGEQALELTQFLITEGECDVVVVDSVSALVPKAELEGEMGDSHVGLQARLMSQAMRKLTGIVKNNNTILIFINQIREKVGVMYGNPETTSGGRALRFYSSVRLDIRRIGAVKDTNDNIVGNQTRVRVKKNKVAPPFKKAEFHIIYGKGIDQTREILMTGIDKGIIEKAHSWYKYKGESVAQGESSVITWLEDNPEVIKEIKNG